jgi:predicted component of type VI protein secretion system
MKVLPVIEEVSRSFELTAQVMGVILDCPVSIREGKKSRKALDKEETVTLGKWRLGINSVPGKAIRNDNVDLEITIGPVSPEQMRLFESGANNDKILKCLIDLTLPFDRNTIVKYKVTESEKKFRLSGGTHKTYLGINTTI